MRGQFSYITRHTQRGFPMGRQSIETMTGRALDAGDGILRLAPNWVPRSFLHPGRRLKLHPDDLYALGADRGGIDERWFASTTAADNDGAPPDEGLSYVVFAEDRFTLRDAIATSGAEIIGQRMWDSYERWPVYSKFFDNMGPIPHHLHQSDEQVAALGRLGKPEGYYFPPQLNYVGNNFPYTFFGLEPGTTREQVRSWLERWNEGDNGILDLAKAYRLKPGTGWLVGPRLLHAPGSLVTYEPQWGSDVFGMYQSLVEGRSVPWDLLVKDVPEDKKQDLDYLVEVIDWDANPDPNFKDNHYLEPIAVADTADEGYMDRWVVYGECDGRQCFTAKELTVNPGVTATITDNGAYGLIVMQGRGRIGKLPVHSPAMIRFGQMTEDELFITASAATSGVTFTSESAHEPLVVLRYFGPDVNPDAPQVGDHNKIAH